MPMVVGRESGYGAPNGGKATGRAAARSLRDRDSSSAGVGGGQADRIRLTASETKLTAACSRPQACSSSMKMAGGRGASEKG